MGHAGPIADERELPEEVQYQLTRLDGLFSWALVGLFWSPLGAAAGEYLAGRMGAPLPVIWGVCGAIGAVGVYCLAQVIAIPIRLRFGVLCPHCASRLSRGRRPREFSRRGRWLYRCEPCGIDWDSGIRPENFAQPNG
jgi:hypothetical protein